MRFFSAGNHPAGVSRASRAREIFFGQTLIFLFISGFYYAWVWSDELGDYGGDNAIYLLTAKYFSPWSGEDAIAVYFATHSQYPPLYPFVLAIFGGGESLFAAHIITVTFLLLAFVALYRWLRSLGVDNVGSTLITFLFALLPGTYMQALSVLSENLFLFLTLTAIAAVTKAETDQKEQWLWIAAGSIAAATLTRSAGISLLAAFFIYLLLQRQPRIWYLSILAATPMVLWSLFNSQEGPNYLTSLGEMYGEDPLAIFLKHIGTQGYALWYGWITNFTSSRVGIPVMSFVGVIVLSGMCYRLYKRKFDGLYTAAYLLLILVWPYPAEATRFVYVVAPVLLIQGVLLLGLLPNLKLFEYRVSMRYVLILAIALIALPNLLLTAQRFMHPLSPEMEGFRHSRVWYQDDIRGAYASIQIENALVQGLKDIKRLVPEHACIYAIKPSIVGYYSERRSMVPPQAHSDEPTFRALLKKGNCRFFYLMGIVSPSFSDAYYPAQRLHESLRILQITTIPENDKTPVGILAELTGAN